jgi:hypothetical protein
MVRAILEGWKIQTRRIVNNMPTEVPGGYFDAYNKENWWNWWTKDHRPALPQINCPYGNLGDRLWVRETWAPAFEPYEFIYRADNVDPIDRWRPSIHMPRWASRITLEVESVRVERLNDCSAEDALAEGVSDRDPDTGAWQNPKEQYADLWESINGPGSWEANPWVWVVTFRRIKPE